MTERLQKIIARSGLCSRRSAEELLTAGRVTCNGLPVKLGDTADEEKDAILVDGRPLPSTEKAVYMMLNKPRGYISACSDDRGRKTVTELVESCGVRVYPVGRLDMDSEGLLLLTNDGAFANQMMHPSHEVKKVYRVWVSGFCENSVFLLRRPVELDGYRIRKPEIRLVRQTGEKALLEVTIHEGRNRQVRRMCEMAGLAVQRLQRIQEGSLRLGDLPLGSYRHLTAEELETVRRC